MHSLTPLEQLDLSRFDTLAILKKQFGQRILGDAMQEAIDAAMRDHFDKTGDRPALQPEVKMVGGEDWKEGQDVVVEMSYDALPPIPEVDASKVEATFDKGVLKVTLPKLPQEQSRVQKIAVKPQG